MVGHLRSSECRLRKLLQPALSGIIAFKVAEEEVFGAP